MVTHRLCRVLAVLSIMIVACAPSLGAETRVAFDLPSAIECRDKTPPEFSAANPSLKVIEAKFRISARIVDGNAADVVDFVYTLESTDKTMRLQDYLPNTTLESAVADDAIEVTNASENATATGAEAHVVYKIFAIGANHNQTSKKADSSHYKQIAAKDLVLASGTTNREHGVFFRLRPSRAASLEGAKEFTFLATVPRTWRGDLCTISCVARARKSSLLSTSVAAAGEDQAQVGMFLMGDATAASLAEALWNAQESYQAALHSHAPKANVLDTISHQTVGLFTGKRTDDPAEGARKKLDDTRRAVTEAEERLRQLAR
jgi:hypothetical protein